MQVIIALFSQVDEIPKLGKEIVENLLMLTFLQIVFQESSELLLVNPALFGCVGQLEKSVKGDSEIADF